MIIDETVKRLADKYILADGSEPPSSVEMHDDHVEEARRTYSNEIDEAMYTPATELTGPNDPKVDVVIAYLRYRVAKGDKPKPSLFAEDGLDLETIKKAGPAKPKAFRRF